MDINQIWMNLLFSAVRSLWRKAGKETLKGLRLFLHLRASRRREKRMKAPPFHTAFKFHGLARNLKNADLLFERDIEVRRSQSPKLWRFFSIS